MDSFRDLSDQVLVKANQIAERKYRRSWLHANDDPTIENLKKRNMDRTVLAQIRLRIHKNR